VGQPQTPAMHDWPVGQAFPQRPQLATSLLVLTQAVLQRVVVPGHAQVPPTHDCAAGQVVPQRPQLLRSALRLTQAVPQ
jgi:hypothetical protein